MKKEFNLYHASVESFSEFDESRIRQFETDAPFNGFWFSSNERTSCAWRNPNYLKECTIRLDNPCTWEDIYKVLKDNPFISCTDLRKRMVELGYDGIVYSDKPEINRKELIAKGRTFYKSARGNTYELRNEKEGDIERLYLYYDDECITGYCDVDDFLSSREIVVVSFTNKNIEVISERKNPFWS